MSLFTDRYVVKFIQSKSTGQFKDKQRYYQRQSPLEYMFGDDFMLYIT